MGTILELAGSGIFGGIFGGLLRLAPMIVDFFKVRQANAHEVAMVKLQMDRDKLLAEQAIEKIRTEAQVVLDRGGLAALKEAITAQGRPTGDPKIDRRSASVRPNVTYAFLWTYLGVKIAMVLISVLSAFRVNADILDVIAGATAILWTNQDVAIFAGIINFWFLDRVIRKNEGRI